MATLRIKGVHGRGFRHAGLELSGKTWLEVEVTPERRETIRDFHGRYIIIHPDDRPRLKREFGLELVTNGEPLVESKAVKASNPRPTPEGSGQKSNSQPASSTPATKEK